MVTADALHTQRETARFLVEEKGAHYLSLVMVAMLFLLKERLALQAEAPMLSLADLVMAINQLLPRPEPTPNRIASIIHERHRRRQDALAACLRRESEI